MKKILIAFANDPLPAGAFEFAKQLNDIHPILLIGIFLREIAYLKIREPAYFEGLGLPSYAHEVETFAEDVIEKKIEWFKSLCRKNNIEYSVHKDTDDLAMHELKKETRFADVVILSTESFFAAHDKIEISSQLKTILHLSECPALIIPPQFHFPESIVLAYDGSESAAYAIKQFAYVFPELCSKNVLVVYAGKYEEKTFPDEILIQELAARHFSDLNFLKLDSPSQFLTWINKAKNSLLVTGSFGRSDLSELFKKSFVADIIRENKIPAFVAHK